MKKKAYLLIIFAVLFASSVGSFLIPAHMFMDTDQERSLLISLKNSIQEELRPKHQYRCCLEQPCTYCIEKTPGHGEGAVCDCLSDIINGVHPCGECIGEILEGHGNKYLRKYFAKAIAEKTGEEEAIKRIIEDKYGIPVGDQV